MWERILCVFFFSDFDSPLAQFTLGSWDGFVGPSPLERQQIYARNDGSFCGGGPSLGGSSTSDAMQAYSDDWDARIIM